MRKNNLLKKGLVVGVIFLLVLVLYGQNISANEGGVFDKVKVSCRGPYLMDVIFRTHVVHITVINHDEDEAYRYRIKATVSKPNGEVIFGPINDYHKIEPNHKYNYLIAPFYSFEKVNHMFGFFKADVELKVYHDEGSSTKHWTFTGFIFVISAIIFQI